MAVPVYSPGRAHSLSGTVRARLEAYDHPGNICEQCNIPERATRLANHLPPELADSASGSMPGVGGIVPLETAELRYPQWALARHGGDRKSLAAQLGISERTLYRRLAG